MKFWKHLVGMTLGLAWVAQAGCGDAAKPVNISWYVNGNEARQMALQVHRPLLVAFMGSDWSEPCQTMTKDVLNTDTFKAFADQNLVLVKIDFPRTGNQPPDMIQSNAKLAKDAQVDRFPTFLLVDPRNGGSMGRIVNFEGGAEAFVNKIREAVLQWQQNLATPPPRPAVPATLNPPTPAAAPSSLPSVDELRRQAAPPGADPGLTLPSLPTH